MFVGIPFRLSTAMNIGEFREQFGCSGTVFSHKTPSPHAVIFPSIFPRARGFGFVLGGGPFRSRSPILLATEAKSEICASCWFRESRSEYLIWSKGVALSERGDAYSREQYGRCPRSQALAQGRIFLQRQRVKTLDTMRPEL
jgi:hypothetical protein